MIMMVGGGAGDNQHHHFPIFSTFHLWCRCCYHGIHKFIQSCGTKYATKYLVRPVSLNAHPSLHSSLGAIFSDIKNFALHWHILKCAVRFHHPCGRVVRERERERGGVWMLIDILIKLIVFFNENIFVIFFIFYFCKPFIIINRHLLLTHF